MNFFERLQYIFFMDSKIKELENKIQELTEIVNSQKVLIESLQIKNKYWW